jgi:predicted nucleic acid-binding protein
MDIADDTELALGPFHIVLDTNVVLDWLVFRNATLAPIAAAIESGQLRWIATTAMRNELAHVLGRGVVSAWSPDESALWIHWDRWVLVVDEPPKPALSHRLRCTDVDDQKFIDLAVSRARWLVSRDRAVLKLARRAAPLGLKVMSPAQWDAVDNQTS